MNDLTGFQRDLLFIIAGLDDPNGLAIKDELDAYYDKHIPRSRVYPNLDTLCEKALAEKQPHESPQNTYQLTEQGRQALRERYNWEQQFLDTAVVPQ